MPLSKSTTIIPRVVLFNGPPRSGKDTAASMLSSALVEAGIPVYKQSFARPLKQAVHALFGMDYLPVNHFEKEKEIKQELLHGDTPRQAYIAMSEEFAKVRYGKNFFVDIAVESVRKVNLGVSIFSDCGFQAEVDEMAKAFGAENVAVVRMLRQGVSYGNDSRGYVEECGDVRLNLRNMGTIDQLQFEINHFRDLLIQKWGLTTPSA